LLELQVRQIYNKEHETLLALVCVLCAYNIKYGWHYNISTILKIKWGFIICVSICILKISVLYNIPELLFFSFYVCFYINCQFVYWQFCIIHNNDVTRKDHSAVTTVAYCPLRTLSFMYTSQWWWWWCQFNVTFPCLHGSDDLFYNTFST